VRNCYVLKKLFKAAKCVMKNMLTLFGASFSVSVKEICCIYVAL